MHRPAHAALLACALAGAASHLQADPATPAAGEGAAATTCPCAAATVPPANPGWAGSMDIGYTAVGGNSQSSSLVTAATGARATGRYTHAFEVRASNASEGTQRTAEAYHLLGKESYALGERSYLFLDLAWDKDRFNGYEWQLGSTAGYGYRLLASERQVLALEAGPGFRHDELPAGDTEDTATAHAGLDYLRHLNDRSDFHQLLEADAGEENTLTRSLTELAYHLNEHLALKASLEIRRNDEPPAGTRNSDRTAALSLAWTY